MIDELKNQHDAKQGERDKLIESKPDALPKIVEKRESETQTTPITLTLDSTDSAMRPKSHRKSSSTSHKAQNPDDTKSTQQDKDTDSSDDDQSSTSLSSSSSSSRRQRNNNSIMCRICHCEETSEEYLIAPCYCSGTLRYVHQSCLQQWLKSKQGQLKKINFFL